MSSNAALERMMPGRRDEIEQQKKLLVEMLAGQASLLLIERLLERLDDVVAGRATLEETLRGIHLSVHLFVDESLAAMLDRRLRQVTGTT